MRIMSVDYGDVRTGLAICDRDEILASPLAVIEERNFKACAAKISERAVDERAERIVVGYPRNMDNTSGERTEKCEQLAALIEKLSSIPAVLYDERSTTVLAHNYLNATNVRGKKRKAVVDAVAAVIILENYLSFRKNKAE